MGTGCRVPGWAGEVCSACCRLEELLVMIGARFSWEFLSAVPSILVGLSPAPAPCVSAPAFSSTGTLESAVLDSAALVSCFFTGVDWEVRLVLPGTAGLTFSCGAASPLDWCSLGAKHGRQESRPPDRFDLLRVEPSRCADAGTGGCWLVFSEAAARCWERLLLAVLPARRLFKKLRLECFEPRPMLSESAAVTPLRPVLGVWSSVDPEAAPVWGTPRNDCFCLESASVPAALRCSSVAGSRDDDRGGTTVFWGPTGRSQYIVLEFEHALLQWCTTYLCRWAVGWSWWPAACRSSAAR